MESFYGGRQGASFIIKKKFEYLNLKDPAYLATHGFKAYEGIKNGQHCFISRENGSSVSSNLDFDKVMELCLADESYKDVWYNEYCIIDTKNKNNINNGKIFRRRFPDQTADGLPYEEIGAIVGPSSGAPMLKPQSGLLNFETIRSQLPEGHWDGLGLSEDKNNNTILKIYDPSFSDGDLSTWPSGVTLKENSIKMEEGLVEGASNFESEYDSSVGAVVHKPGTIVDEIKYNWFNVRKNTENDEGVVESWCYIGFEVPTTVFSVSAKYKTPGTQPEAYEVERTNGSIGHPFWYDWRFEIPGGLRGVSIEKIFINDTNLKDNDNNNLYEVSAYVFDDLDYNTTTDTYTFIKDATPKTYKDRSWFCEARILNPSTTTESPELLKQTNDSDTVTFFLGEITEIDKVTLNTETGHLEFVYHNQASDSYDLRYPIDIDFEKTTDNDYQGLEIPTPIDYNNGKYTITYSYADTDKGEEKTESDQLGFVRKVSITEDDKGENGSITFVNTIDKQNQIYPFSYPQTLTLNSETGEWAVEYFGAKNISGRIDFVDKAFIDSDTGKITFHHTKATEGVTDTSGNFTQDFIYPKLFDLDPNTGNYTIYYSNSSNNTSNQLVFPKSVQIDKEGIFSYINSANQKISQEEKIVFIDDVFVDNAHQLWIAYTDNTKMESQGIEIGTPLDKNGVPLENGKTYINYGKTLGKLGIVSGPVPENNSDKINIDAIIAWYNDTYKLGIIDNEVSSALHVVTTEPVDGTKPISYFVMWDPDTGKWYNVSEIAGSPVGIPAQIGSDSDSWTYQDSLLLADGHVRFVTEQIVTLSEDDLAVENPVYWK